MSNPEFQTADELAGTAEFFAEGVGSDPWTGELLIGASPPSVIYIAPSQRRPRQEAPLAEHPVVVGRSPDADLQVFDRFASRRHFALVWAGGEVRVHDLQSRHGTFVNNERIDTHALQSGDSLDVGMTRLVVRLTGK